MCCAWSVECSAVAFLHGQVQDDGQPQPPGAVHVLWNKVSGPGNVTFAEPEAAETPGTFSEGVSYVLRLVGRVQRRGVPAWPGAGRWPATAARRRACSLEQGERTWQRDLRRAGSCRDPRDFFRGR